MLGYVDQSLQPKKLKLQLAKPNKQVIANLNHIYNLEYNPALGRLSEVSFTMPYEILDELNNEVIRNPTIDKILDRYLIKGTIEDQVEWFIINEIKDEMDETKDTKYVHAYSLGYELKDKNVRGYKVTSYNLPQVVDDVLSMSIWNVGEIEPQFYLKYRSFDVSEQTVLDFIYEVADTYDALIEFDTINRLIHFKDVEKIGENKGLTISYGKYLKRLGKTSEPDEMVTRLYAYGKDELSINRVNPAGSSYLEDFTYFMYPFDTVKKWSDIEDKKWEEL